MIVELRKKHIQWSIDQDPSTIKILRKEKVRAGGGFDEVAKELGPFKVRVFQKSSLSPVSEKSDLVGTKHTSPAWGMLADYQADIKANSTTIDEFVDEKLGRFQITSIIPQVFGGEIVGYQVELERVN